MRLQIDGIVGKDSVVKSWSRESFHIYLFHLFQIHKDTSDNIVSLIAIYLCMHHDTSLLSIMVQRFCRHLPCRKISGSKVSCYDCLWLGPKGYRSESWNPFAFYDIAVYMPLTHRGQDKMVKMLKFVPKGPTCNNFNICPYNGLVLNRRQAIFWTIDVLVYYWRIYTPIAHQGSMWSRIELYRIIASSKSCHDSLCSGVADYSTMFTYQSGRSPKVVALFLLQTLVAIWYDFFNCMIQSKWNQIIQESTIIIII